MTKSASESSAQSSQKSKAAAATFLIRFSVPPETRVAGLQLAEDAEIFETPTGQVFLALVFANPDAPEVVRLQWSDRNRSLLEMACSCSDIGQWRPCPHAMAMLAKLANTSIAGLLPDGELNIRGEKLVSVDKNRYLGTLLKASRRALEIAEKKRAAVLKSTYSAYSPSSDNWSRWTSPKRRHDPWRERLQELRPTTLNPQQRKPERARNLFYILEEYKERAGSFVLGFWNTERRQNGDWGVFKNGSLDSSQLGDLPINERRMVLRLLHLKRDAQSGFDNIRTQTVVLSPELLALFLPELAATGRFGRVDYHNKFTPLAWDDGGPFELIFEGREMEGEMVLLGKLRRGEEVLPLTEIRSLGGGFFHHLGRIGRLKETCSPGWLAALIKAKPIHVPPEEIEQALIFLAESDSPPAVALDPKWKNRIQSGKPAPALRLKVEGEEGMLARILFYYADIEVTPADRRSLLKLEGGSRWLQRNLAEEVALLGRLPFPVDDDGRGIPAAEGFVELLEALAAEGWRIGVDGKKLRTGGRFQLRVESGMDWFDLAGNMDFSGQAAELPALLQAAREGRNWINLKDGSVGLLPAGWANRWISLVDLAGGREGLRFWKGQAVVLDHLLLTPDPNVHIEIDAVFAQVRERIHSLTRLKPMTEPKNFHGELRPYQRLGLAWIHLLADMRLGGCLADDMGLGKTVQVISYLLTRKNSGVPAGRPSLLVVPRSLIFNWARELERFAPELGVHVSHGTSRADTFAQIGRSDVVITTYGTLVRDIEKLSTLEFDLVLLDEAQAVKNRQTQAAEACRSLKARQRLALTGTPIENHLGELWSIFDFLNPGLLGKLPQLSQYAGRQRLPPEALAEVARALRPLILRRKKSEVLQDLPAKTEQTLICELSAEERKNYDDLRRHYQKLLRERIADSGFEKSKIYVLEALLRLRQAACHPGLIDKTYKQSSSKIDLLLENLEQILEEGHKALIFSQFTTLLTLVKKELDAKGYRYEYLDGKTRDREARVQRFQTDPEIPLFLISLKAGGVGLNLTAASYVFLLDPWWNPATEAQAIDRTHRIGQQQPVFAYRIIAENTVEEKILAMQADKRALAEAIIGEDQRMLKQLTTADLDQLLS